MGSEGDISIGGPPGRLRATLTIRGRDLDPEEISLKMMCLPDKAHRRDQPRKHGVPYKDGAWSIVATSDGEQTASDLIDLLLARVPGAADVWDGLRPACQMSLALYVYLTSDNQDFVLGSEQVLSLARIGASIWVDMYVGDDE